MIIRSTLGLLVCLGLSACGVADTATSAAAVADARTREIEPARTATAQVQQRLDAANATAMARLKAAEAQ